MQSILYVHAGQSDGNPKSGILEPEWPYDPAVFFLHPCLISLLFLEGKFGTCLNNVISIEFQPVCPTLYTSPTACSNQYAPLSTHHLQLVPTSMPHSLHITYSLFQPLFPTLYTSPTACSYQYAPLSTHHLQLVPTSMPHSLHITYSLFQPV
jgi:hypothetical protein